MNVIMVKNSEISVMDQLDSVEEGIEGQREKFLVVPQNRVARGKGKNILFRDETQLGSHYGSGVFSVPLQDVHEMKILESR